MFGFGLSELLVILIVIVALINPKELPSIIRKVGAIYGFCIKQLNGMKRAVKKIDEEIQEQAEQESSLEPSDENVEEATQTVTASTQVKGNVFNVLNKEELAMQKGVVGRFLFILAALYRTHKKDFANVLEIKGRDRVYFATSKEALLESGSSMNPKNITDTEYWVMTNSNTTRKKMMLHEVALCLGYSADEAEKIRDYL
mgnify:CR=1 FL=1